MTVHPAIANMPKACPVNDMKLSLGCFLRFKIHVCCDD